MDSLLVPGWDLPPPFYLGDPNHRAGLPGGAENFISELLSWMGQLLWWLVVRQTLLSARLKEPHSGNSYSRAELCGQLTLVDFAALMRIYRSIWLDNGAALCFVNSDLLNTASPGHYHYIRSSTLASSLWFTFSPIASRF